MVMEKGAEILLVLCVIHFRIQVPDGHTLSVRLRETINCKGWYTICSLLYTCVVSLRSW